ncbi:MAG: radical SAM protein [Leptonema illini]|uniref:Radical SAM protein n=1 Tax=Leptonema illini TaxID=183 RepID=A0A833LV82_9LEPT|nr:MAG: radical SAM protein [Leptonema illini]
MYRYLFGPVPSRRLGMSLGVDLVPKKVCSLDCVYCEAGATTRLTVERKEYVPYADLTAELTQFFSSGNPDPDYVTFSGSGEPTLNSRIGDVIAFIKGIRPHIPVAVLTNGTLLSDPEVRKALLAADVVLPSLDAATPRAFRRINRPEKSLSLEGHIDGLVAFRDEFPGRIFLEVFLLPGYNTDEDDILALRKAITRIRPDAIQLNTLDRPGVLEDLRSATAEELQQVIDLLDLPHIEIIASAPQRQAGGAWRRDMEAAIVGTIARRPCTLEDLAEILGHHVNEINTCLEVLTAQGIVEAVHQERGLFYRKRSS